MIDVDILWDRCLEELKYQVKDSVFTMWLRPLSVQQYGEQLVVLAPNQYFVTHVSKHYLNDIEALVRKHSDDVISSVVLRENNSSLATGLSEPTAIYQSQQTSLEIRSVIDDGMSKQSATHSKQVDSNIDKSLSYINPLFTFETFVSGKSNILAYKACFELGKKQSQNRHNPLFIYGASGLGKTHLMHSVAHRYLKIGKSFYYFSSEKFINQLVYALRNQKIEEFKKKIKRVDLLIIDDVHVLAGKTKSSSEFLSLFADFMMDDKQIILASDRHPSQMTEFDERFRSRFSWGLAVAVEPPEMETRMQILQKKAKLSGIELPKECALFIAQNVVSNVRRLEGALNQVLANANLTGQPIDLDMVQYALKDIVAMRVQSVSMDNIRKVVAEYYDVSVKDLMGKKRTRSIARPRQIAMALARELTGDSYPDIGQSFGGRDHTTVMHACDKVAQLRQEDPILDKEYKALSMTLQAG
ncbi:chromosomal replication initiator protein DnaA [Psychrobacter sp. I-STPA6b]|uniref:chromosomal replication initiator protein DnaA n=1 Tax=Psychrobacter sp. I-STPA6b TaxID=2585718 RepID=UPI001D0CB0E1|nr:chromosomal replication initiator protein DnaA [Psychrobacter sp. I-STPA6b]